MGLAAAGMVSAGMGGINFGLFIQPMSQDLGIKHYIFGWAQTARLVGFSASSWFIGRMLDRYGARVPMAIAGFFMLLAMFGLSRVKTGSQLLLLIFFIGMIGMQGGGGDLYQSVPLSRWFIRLRGRAMAISFLGMPTGIFIFSPITQYMISTIGWRAAWFFLGGIGSAIVIVVALLIMRKDPESMGLRPDGVVPEGNDHEEKTQWQKKQVNEYQWTRKQAVRTFTFWSLTIGSGIIYFGFGTINIFRIPFYIEQGVNPQMVAWALSAEAVVATISSFPTGWAMDRFQPRFVFTTVIIIFILTFIVNINVTEVWHVFAGTTIFGAMAAGTVVTQNTLWPNYFGWKNIGSIRGFAAPFIMVFGAIGGPITGAIKDSIGTYKPAWLISMVLLVLAAILMFLTPKPVPPE